MRYLKTFKQLYESALNESMTDKIITIVKGFTPPMDSRANRGRVIPMSHQEIINYLKDPESWTDDEYFRDAAGNSYTIEDLIGKKVIIGKDSIDVNEHHFVPSGEVNKYEYKIFRETGPSMIGINVSSLKEYLENFFSVTFDDSSDLQLLQPEKDRYSLEIQLSSKAQMIDSKTWQKLAEEFMEFDLVEDTSEDTNRNRFTLDLREGIEYDLELKETEEDPKGFEVVTEALTKSHFPVGKFDAEYVRLMTLAQKLPKWDEKPYFSRTTATWTIQGKIGGEEVWFEMNTPGSYGAIYNFRGLNKRDSKVKVNSGYSDHFTKSGETLSNWEHAAIVKFAAEKKMSIGVPMVWARVKPTIPDQLYLDNLEDFKKAIESVK